MTNTVLQSRRKAAPSSDVRTHAQRHTFLLLQNRFPELQLTFHPHETAVTDVTTPHDCFSDAAGMSRSPVTHACPLAAVSLPHSAAPVAAFGPALRTAALKAPGLKTTLSWNSEALIFPAVHFPGRPPAKSCTHTGGEGGAAGTGQPGWQLLHRF